jgi:hypothetical protein
VLETTDAESDINKLVKQKIEESRRRLLDLSRRNPLISVNLNPRSSSYVRVVDELPDVLFYNLNHNQEMRFVPLPPIEGDPRDEQAETFIAALSNARLTDEVYLAEIENIFADDEDYINKSAEQERLLKDRVREQLGMAPRAKGRDLNIVQHARNNGISPGYDLPLPTEEHEDGRHTDENIQTLLLAQELERKLNALHTKCRTWVQETGLNVLHVAYGLLEWGEPGSKDLDSAPIILCSAQLEKRRTPKGVEFWISGGGEEPELNAVLVEKLRSQFGIDLPPFDLNSVEQYFAQLGDLSPRNLKWRVRRQVVVGIFPSARLAMYHDLDTREPNFSHNQIVEALLAGCNNNLGSVHFAEEYDVDRPDIESKVPFLVLDADSSQVSTLVDVANGKNLAVEGPPGTGKSQTIVNAIAAAMAAGKKVLFVAEKLAALNVVKSRLEAIGLGEFLLPLQAERSSREQVIAAIRERVHMSPVSSDSVYEKKVSEYRGTRDGLASSISLLIERFEDTELSVREILGRSISQSDRLQHIPLPVLDQCSLSSKSLWGPGLKRLRELCDEFVEVYSDACQAAENWKGTQLVQPERFRIEEACDWALDAARAFYRSSEGRSFLSEMGLPPHTRSESIAEICICLETFPASARHLPIPLIAENLTNDNAAYLKQFLERCQQYQEHHAALNRVLSVDLSAKTATRLRQLQDIGSRRGLDTIDPRTIEERIGSLRRKLAGMRNVASHLEPFVKEHPEGAAWCLRDFAKARLLVQQTGREALTRRSASTSDPSAPHLIRQLVFEGQILLEEKKELIGKVSVTVDFEVDFIESSLGIIRGAGAFSLFSGSFHKAKHFYRSVAVSQGFRKRQAIKDLETLLGWKKKEAAFIKHPQAILLFGVHFNGIHTDFHPFNKLVSFYESLNTEFTKPKSRLIRNFLREADVDSLCDLPDIPPIDSDSTFNDLLESINKYEKGLKKLEGALVQLRDHDGIFANPKDVSIGQISEIAKNLEEHITTRNLLDGDERASTILDSHFRGCETCNTDIDGLASWATKVGPHKEVLLKVFTANQFDEFKRIIQSVVEAREKAGRALVQVCEKAQVEPEHFLANRTEVETAALLEKAGRDADGLTRHAERARVFQELERAGVRPIIEEHIRHKGEIKEIGDLVEALASRKLAKAVYSKHGEKPQDFCIRERYGKWIPTEASKSEKTDTYDSPHYYPPDWTESDGFISVVAE